MKHSAHSHHNSDVRGSAVLRIMHVCFSVVLALVLTLPTHAKEPVQWRVQKYTGELNPDSTPFNLNTTQELATTSDELYVEFEYGKIAVRPQSSLRLRKEISSDAEDTHIVELITGAFRYVSHHLTSARRRGAVRIITPTATLGIRGTDFDVMVITPTEFENSRSTSSSAQLPQPGTYVRVNTGVIALNGLYSKSAPLVLEKGRTGKASYPTFVKQYGSTSQVVEMIPSSVSLNISFPTGKLDKELNLTP